MDVTLDDVKTERREPRSRGPMSAAEAEATMPPSEWDMVDTTIQMVRNAKLAEAHLPFPHGDIDPTLYAGMRVYVSYMGVEAADRDNAVAAARAVRRSGLSMEEMYTFRC